MNEHLNKITNPIILPVLITIIPLIWYFLISYYGDLEIISIGTFIAGAVLLVIQGSIWYTVFQKRKGTAKIFRNVLNTKDFFKYLAVFSGMILVMLFVSDYLVYHTILNEKNIFTIDQTNNPSQKFKFNNAIWWSFFNSILVLMFLMFCPDRKYGQSYAYFRTIELEKTEVQKFTRFQKGIRFYDEHIDETFDLRIKNIDKIYSSIIFDRPDIRDSKLHTLIAMFTDDQLGPARYLGEISEISQNEFFHKLTDFERFEKYVKIVSVVIAIIALIVPIILNQLQK